jgi:ATP-dependent helicase/nuclease subunit A
MLVLTFTEAAADQMRSRIARQLTDRLLESNDPSIAHQLLMLQAADISTIHSFCRRLIAEYFYKLTIDPSFSVIDADEAMLLKADMLEKTIDWAWHQSDLQQSLADLLYRRKLETSTGFPAKVIDISDFLESVVAPDHWCETALVLTQTADPFATSLGDAQKQIIANKLQSMLAQTEYCLRLCENQHIAGDFVMKWQQGFVSPLSRYLELLRSDEWDAFVGEIRTYEPPARLEYKRAGLSETTIEIVKAVVGKAKFILSEILDLAILNPDYLNIVGASANRQTHVMVRLVRQFRRLYEQAKRSLNCMDFADLEHHALRLLTMPDSPPDNLQPSETALTLRRRYKYIFVDEYQDINPVQQAILRMLGSGGNVFVVGDIKQSIYAFRGAEPKIFTENLLRESFDSANSARALRIDLNANFRSDKGILDFVNKIFSRIMTAPFASVDYDDSARLRPGEQPPGEPSERRIAAPIVEFTILDESAKDEDAESESGNEADEGRQGQLITARQRQAALIARRIKQLVGADTVKPEQIYDRRQKMCRDIRYGDIVVLMRSLAKKANDYVEILRLASIPVTCDSTAGYFQTTEITDVVCLLKILDNPRRDIELAAVLRSPFFNLTDTDLAKIRLHGRIKQPCEYYDCVLAYRAAGPDMALRDKLQQVLSVLDEWRSMARRGAVAELLWQIYRKTGYLSFVSALPNGQARRANLLKLHDRSVQFAGFAGSSTAATLSRFVEFIEKLLEAGEDWAPAQPEHAADDSVRVLSVHKSKGLEFPVVFLAELQSQFNTRDIHQSDVVVDAEHTLGLRVIDRTSNSKLNSLAYEVIADKKLATMLAEEMRILYVAATRAESRLILTASEKQAHCRQVMTEACLFRDGPVPSWHLRNCRSHLDWILSALADQKVLYETFGTETIGNYCDDGLFEFRLCGPKDIEQLSQFVLGLKAGKQRPLELTRAKSCKQASPSALLTQVEKSLSWRYPFEQASILPAKTSVTELTHRNDEYIKFDYSAALDRQPAALSASAADLLNHRRSRLIGTIAHIVISKLDLTRPVTAQTIEDKKSELLAAGAITAELSEQIDADAIQVFFDTKPGRSALDPENTTWREWPFTFALPDDEYYLSSDEPRKMTYEIRDTIIVQGMIDMLVRTPQGLVIIDFKTDRITSSQAGERGELYRQQLELYSRAASAILKMRTIAKWLYFLDPRCAVLLDRR